MGKLVSNGIIDFLLYLGYSTLHRVERQVNIVSYTPQMANKLLAHAEKGGSLTSFRGKERITEQTLLQWTEEHPEFREALELARCVEYGFWEEQMITAIQDGGDFNNEDGMSAQKRMTVAFNMLKHRSAMSMKLHGRDIGDGDLSTEANDPNEFTATTLDDWGQPATKTATTQLVKALEPKKEERPTND